MLQKATHTKKAAQKHRGASFDGGGARKRCRRRRLPQYYPGFWFAWQEHLLFKVSNLPRPTRLPPATLWSDHVAP